VSTFLVDFLPNDINSPFDYSGVLVQRSFFEDYSGPMNMQSSTD
jgi:hypothetical protein